MSVNCTQCGAPVKLGQRFCINCGARVTVEDLHPEDAPKLDLSPYFDDGDDPVSAPSPAEPTPASPPAEQPLKPVSVPHHTLPQQSAARKAAPAPAERKPAAVRRPSAPQQTAGKAAPAPAARKPAEKAEARKGDRLLNLALLICGVLAVGVITYLLLVLFWDNGGRSGEPGEEQLLPSPGQESFSPEEDPQLIIVTPQSGGTDGSVLIVSPTPQADPSPLIPVVTTPSPTPAVKTGEDYLLPESDSRYLTEADLSGLSHEQLCFARNEIFARHGRIFKTPEIAAYFAGKSWYKGTVSAESFNEKDLNPYEWANISFIREYENKHFGGSYY